MHIPNPLDWTVNNERLVVDGLTNALKKKTIYKVVNWSTGVLIAFLTFVYSFDYLQVQ